ncbi:DNA-binding protein [Halomonas sp. M20]|uniref:DNA-binding protein n=1 Tax=Halomonas sp. M20 TaxID=2763264 RepID=UPI001D0A57FA|nr:DNA-binding protein [Halomonas sp. M20]
MARSGVRYEDVQKAIHQLLQRGETPGVQKIREVLGTGSFTTLSEHLRQWKIEREENRDEPPAQDLPEPLQTLTQELWHQAQEAARQGLAQYREEADQRVYESQSIEQEAQRRAEDAIQRESAMAEHLAALQTRLDEKSMVLAQVQAQLDASHAERESTAAKNARLEERLDQLREQSNAEAAEYRQALDEQARQFDARIAQEEQRHETAEAKLMALLDDARRERQEQEKQHVKRQAQTDKRVEGLEMSLQEQRAALVEEEARHREAKWELRRFGDTEREMIFKQEQLEAQIAERDQRLEQLQEALREAETRVARTPLPPFVY